MTKTLRLAIYFGIAWYDQHATITSAEISRQTGINATQIRRDLSEFLGPVGKRGVGYKAGDLIDKLSPHVRTAEDEWMREARQLDTNTGHARWASTALTGFIERRK